MNDFQKPIDNRERPKDWLIIHKLEKDKKGKEEYPKKENEASQKKTLFFSALLFSLKKNLSFCTPIQFSKSEPLDKNQLINDLVSIRGVLTALRKEDSSERTEFTQQLSEMWRLLLEDCEKAHFQQISDREQLIQIRLFIERINTYPLDEEHSLGFYLTHYVGQKWLPFPFIEMLRQLYIEDQQDPAQSHLQEWISHLNGIITSLND